MSLTFSSHADFILFARSYIFKFRYYILFQILFVFKVGHSVQRKPKPVNGRTHHWRCYVDSWSPRYPLSAFVKKVTFKLHSTFENPRQGVRLRLFYVYMYVYVI